VPGEVLLQALDRIFDATIWIFHVKLLSNKTSISCVGRYFIKVFREMEEPLQTGPIFRLFKVVEDVALRATTKLHEIPILAEPSTTLLTRKPRRYARPRTPARRKIGVADPAGASRHSA
jgi:hypothetical protein